MAWMSGAATPLNWARLTLRLSVKNGGFDRLVIGILRFNRDLSWLSSTAA